MANSFQRTFQYLRTVNNLVDGTLQPIPPMPPLQPAPTALPDPTIPSPAGFYPDPDPPVPVQTSDLTFVPGKCRGKTNAILAGHRYITDRKREEREYWKCSLWKDGCKARIITDQRRLATATAPSHTHDIQHSEIAVHVAKQTLKRKAVESEATTRDVVASSTGDLREEEIAKLGCKVSSLHRMARKARSSLRDYPSNPANLEELSIPTTPFGDFCR